MSVPLLDVQHGEFDVRNLLLQLSLGLLAKSEQLDALLDRTAAPRAAAAAVSDDAASADPLLAFALGLVSLREKLRGSLADAAREAPEPAEAAAAADVRGAVTELLR